MKILVVDDNRGHAAFLSRAFSEQSYVVDICSSGGDVVALTGSTPYDLIVLDWNLPDQDGLSVCRELREKGTRAPVLMLSVRREVVEKVMALDAGADDFLSKPFHLDELLARARALVRRSSGRHDGNIRAGALRIDERRRTAFLNDEPLSLTQRELELLVCLVLRAGQIVSRSEILSSVWGMSRDPGSNVIDVHVVHLRSKLGPLAKCLETVRGVGYRLAIPLEDVGVSA